MTSTLPGHGSAWVTTSVPSAPRSDSNKSSSASSGTSVSSAAHIFSRPRPGRRGEAGPPAERVCGSRRRMVSWNAGMTSSRAARSDISRIDAAITVAVARPHICAAMRAAEGSLPVKIDSKVIPDTSPITTTPRLRSAAYSRGASGRHPKPAISRTIPSPPELCDIDVDRKHFAMTVRAPAVAVVEPSTQHRATLVRTPS